MNRFHQRLREDLNDSEFTEAFYAMSADIALLQALEEANIIQREDRRKAPTQPPRRPRSLRHPK